MVFVLELTKTVIYCKINSKKQMQQKNGVFHMVTQERQHALPLMCQLRVVLYIKIEIEVKKQQVISNLKQLSLNTKVLCMEKQKEIL